MTKGDDFKKAFAFLRSSPDLRAESTLMSAHDYEDTLRFAGLSEEEIQRRMEIVTTPTTQFKWEDIEELAHTDLIIHHCLSSYVMTSREQQLIQMVGMLAKEVGRLGDELCRAITNQRVVIKVSNEELQGDFQIAGTNPGLDSGSGS